MSSVKPRPSRSLRSVLAGLLLLAFVSTRVPAEEVINLAAEANGGQLVYVSSQLAPPRGLLDADRVAGSFCFPDDGFFPQVITLAFSRNRPVELREVLLCIEPGAARDRRIAELELQVSPFDSRSGFASVAVIQDFPVDAWPLRIELEDTSGRFLRLLIRSTHGGKGATLAEVEVQGRFLDEQRIVAREEELEASRRASEDAELWRRRVAVSRPEEKLLDDASDRRLDEHSLAQAALIASGVGEASELARYQKLLQDAVGKARAAGLHADDQQQRARALFKFMHRELLASGYELACTNLTRVLDSGQFNCVSSCVLYNCLLGEFGIEAYGVEVPGHAFSLLHLPGGTIDVETTCSAWFDVLDSPEGQVRMVEQTTGFQYISDRSSHQRREVPPLGLVALVYYNRGVDFLRESKYEESISANFKALAVDPASSSALQNLMAAYNQWALSQADEKCFEEATDLLREARGIHPFDPVFRVNYRAVFFRWSQFLLQQENFPKALEVLARAHQDDPEEEYFDQARFTAYGAWARAAHRDSGLEAAIGVFDQARRRFPGHKALLEQEVSFFNKVALDHFHGGEAEAALALLDRGLERNPGVSLLESNWQAVRCQWGMSFYEQKDYARAIETWTRGVAPDRLGSLLRGNCLAAYSQWAQQLAREGALREAVEVARRATEAPQLLTDATTGKEAAALLETILHNALVELINRGDYEASRELLQQILPIEAVSANEKLCQRLIEDHRTTYTNAAVAPSNEGRPDQTAALVEAARSDPVLQSADAFPGKLLELHQQAWLKKAYLAAEAKRYDEAVQAAREGRQDPLLRGDREASRKLLQFAGDCRLQEGNEALETEQWGSAIVAYRKGLSEAPKHGGLRNNMRYAYQQWVRQLEEAGDLEEARKVLRQAIEDDPGEQRWKKKLESLEQENVPGD